MRCLWLLGFVALAACATDASADEDDDVDSGEDALSSAAIASYAAVAPPELRVATGPIAVKLGAPIAEGHRLSVIRTLTINGAPAKVVVDADRLQTSLVETAALEAGSAKNAFADAPFEKSLASLSAGTKALSHLGPEAPRVAAEQFALTIDMCQSHKPWEKRLFDWIVSLSNQVHAPIPIGIAMTGVWAKAHTAELDQLNAWEAQGKLAITWVNHSSTHPLHCKNASCSQATFLTEPGTDMNEEVFGLERSLLARGMMPSTLFRFPGLVHDQERLKELARLSLMPLDADAWIAKGEPIKDGAVVLVHGNGNEPLGITGFLKQVTTGARATNLTNGKSKIVAPLLVSPSAPR
jgi:hypothetical protein